MVHPKTVILRQQNFPAPWRLLRTWVKKLSQELMMQQQRQWSCKSPICLDLRSKGPRKMKVPFGYFT